MTHPTNRRLLILGIVLLCLDAGVSIAGGLYKWVDQDGNVHFSDSPGTADAQKLNEVEPAKSEPERRKIGLAERREKMKQLQEHWGPRDDRSGQEMRELKAEYEADKAAKIQAAVDEAAAHKPAWQQKAIDSCNSGGIRKDCDSAEQIQKRRPLSDERREKRRERRMESKIRRPR
jgi:hypothetical protein